MKQRRAHTATMLIYINAFMVGSVLMGFEMLGSRYLFPYFGGGIATWAGLISVVLLALAIGYFAGGIIVDRHPSPSDIFIAIGAAALYLAFIPSTADRVLDWFLRAAGGGPLGILLAVSALLLVPMACLGTFSPMAVRLLLPSTEKTGRTAGYVYGISTVGNVFGTLFTTFVLIPTLGSRMITYVFALVLALCALSLYFGSRKAA